MGVETVGKAEQKAAGDVQNMATRGDGKIESIIFEHVERRK